MSSMELDAENPVALVTVIGGKERTFAKLTMRDFANLRARMPADERKGASFGVIVDWTLSPDGIVYLVHAAGAKVDFVLTPAEVEGWPVDELVELADELRRLSCGRLIGPKAEPETSADPNLETAGMQDVTGSPTPPISAEADTLLTRGG